MHIQLPPPSASRMFNALDASGGQSAEPEPGRGLALDSHTLLRGHKTVTIVHNGASYRLQATKLGKLILTK
ncbi:MAG: hemin uptake protein HemP [Proteobacteria bacterium]|nr:hemin uptake protein HemP [Pseudomonadota bacterium]